ncbi:hypothetical protein RchiOBHm_Chr7g0195731 [Rosa chinensis]|uniref:Uncharacterized protein n=1 Tax=Rosa chinensis TaxID=74649 RepID=A0A2P6P6G0_ROSCH|nr:hypothetical protein RchiOBHm_Chr7g0195731 [Rosa chinensis]
MLPLQSYSHQYEARHYQQDATQLSSLLSYSSLYNLLQSLLQAYFRLPHQPLAEPERSSSSSAKA